MTKYVVATVDPSFTMTEEQQELIGNLPYGEDVYDNKDGDCFYSIDRGFLDVYKRGTLNECEQYLAENISGTTIERLFGILEDTQ